ncbi:DENN domain-containing protein, partial [Operophtera brumata]
NVRLSEIGDVVILDVDENELRTPFRDLESLPPDLVASLKKDLSNKNALGDAVSRAFLRALVCLIGGYRDAIKIENGQLITFNPEAFFIDERLDLLNSGRGFNDEFEVECNHYADTINSGSGQKLKQQYKDWGKTIKKEGGAFFKHFKNKVRQGGKNMKSAVKGLKNRMPRTGSRPSSINTTDDSRYSCGSATPVSSDSSDSYASHEPLHEPPREPPRESLREPPSALPLDLLTEMEFLFANKQARRDSTPTVSRAEHICNADKAKTMSPCLPPRLAERPQLPTRYPIISTRRLIDVSEAPVPPPRSAAPAPRLSASHFISNITRTAQEQTPSFHTSTLCFGDDNDKPKLKLTMSSNQRRLLTSNGTNTETKLPRPMPPLTARLQESSGSDSDLIKLDDTPNELEEFDPLKCRDRSHKIEPIKSSADSALLHEYGLDFSRFGLVDITPSGSTQPGNSKDGNTNVPKGWTTFY